MADAEKSLLFVIKANIEDYNKKLGDAERNFKRTWGNIQRHFETTAKNMMAIGGAITAAFVGATMNFAKTAEELANMSARTGIGVEELQRLVYAAKTSGSSLEGLETSVKRMQVAIASGSSAFKDLSISLAELKTLSPDQQLKRILAAIAAIPDPAKRAAAAIEIFGREGTDLLPMLEGGAEGFNRLTGEANVFSEDMIRNGAALQHSFEQLNDKFKELLGSLAQTDAFKNLIENFSRILEKVIDFIKEHPVLVNAFFKVGAAILIAGGAIFTMVKAVALLKAVMGGLKGALETAAALGIVAAALWGVNELTKTPAPETPEIPAAQHGAIFTRPTLAMVGEVPEVAMPLSRLGSMGIGGGTVTNHYHFAGFITDEMALRGFVREIEVLQRQEGNRSFHGPTRTEPYVPNHL